MVRMQDVADRARVSIATVSFVVNGSKPVGRATRERVQTAMDELGYTPNAHARALASSRSRIVALLFPGFDARLNPTVMEFFAAAAAAAKEREHHLVVWPVENDDRASLRAYLDSALADGVLAMEVQMDDPRVAVLEEARVPFVLIGRTAEPERFRYADIDFAASTADALARLAGLGHEEVALVLGPRSTVPDTGPAVRAEEAYRSARAGSAQLVVHCGRDPRSGSEAVTELLGAMPGLTAAVVLNDEAAPGVVRGLRAAGRSVPDDVSVLGLGMSASSAAFCDPVLTHLAAPASDLGRTAAETLIDRLDDPGAPLVQVLLPCTFVDGGSLAAAPAAHGGAATSR